MKMKPKSTVHNNKALVYRRFIGLEKSINLNFIYKTVDDNKFWTFDCENLRFDNIDNSLIPTTSIIREIHGRDLLSYQGLYFAYPLIFEPEIGFFYEWRRVNFDDSLILLSATFNNIGKYQTNKYYYVGSFDYMIKGGIEGTTTQYIKGNITPLTSLNIKYFNDHIDLRVDDLVVLEKQLFSVENPETVQKMQPKPLKIYFATLNSIL